ncbi:GNAT family protein [uncultured Algimonas sp.]|uniref:GNAT family N-acetyltransferase n=1 Tax=uncultured Algimonas sp. TaxID=1547920 RepID=UPI00260ECEB4|nr:GNAT family protein [uncultured Algimonas sp.]
MALIQPSRRVTTATEIAVPGAGAMLLLRHPRWSDFETWAEIRRRDADYLRPWEPEWLDGHLSRASYRLRLSRFKKLVASDRAYPFHIVRSDTQALIGAANLTHVERAAAQSAKLGYWVSRAHINRGYARAAVKALSAFAFDTLALHRIEAAVQPDNAASIRVLEANGFAHEGTARGLLRINGQWADHVVYSRLRSD